MTRTDAVHRSGPQRRSAGSSADKRRIERRQAVSDSRCTGVFGQFAGSGRRRGEHAGGIRRRGDDIGFNPQFFDRCAPRVQTPEFQMEFGQPDRPGVIKSRHDFPVRSDADQSRLTGLLSPGMKNPIGMWEQRWAREERPRRARSVIWFSGFVDRLGPVHTQYDSVAEALESLLPGGLRAHCRIGGSRQRLPEGPGGRLQATCSSCNCARQCCCGNCSGRVRRQRSAASTSR